MTEKSKILVIDDSETIRLQLRDILQQGGHVVVEACDGRDGLEKLAIHKDLSLVVCDVNMPEMSGLEMLRAAREKNLISAPVFMLTTETARVKDAKFLRVTAWILKPVDANSLNGAVSQVLALEKRASSK